MDTNVPAAELQAVLQDDVKLGWPRSIAQHIARVALYQLTGLNALHVQVQPFVKSIEDYAKTIGATVELAGTFRTFDYQNQLYAQGRTTAGAIVTQAQGGQSYHNYGLAFDLTVTALPAGLTQEQCYAHLGAFAVTLGMVWGGDFDDYDHFEYHPAFTWHDIINFFTVII